MKGDKEMNLTPEELALLKKLGIPDTVLKTKAPRSPKDPSKAPKLIELSGESATIKISCLCCGTITESFADYVKRNDGSGYGIKFVSKPTAIPTREHQRTVMFCGNCSTEHLHEKSKKELVDMIINLRKHK